MHTILIQKWGFFKQPPLQTLQVPQQSDNRCCEFTRLNMEHAHQTEHGRSGIRPSTAVLTVLTRTLPSKNGLFSVAASAYVSPEPTKM